MPSAERPVVLVLHGVGPLRDGALAEALLLDRLDQLATVEGVRVLRAEADPAAQATRLLAGGAAAVLVLGSDSPRLPTRRVREALAPLTAGTLDVVLLPADDGGWLGLGLGRVAAVRSASLLAEVEAEGVRARTREAGLRLLALAPWRRVRDADDLEHLREGLHEAVWPPRTAELLRRVPAPQPAPPCDDLAEAPWGTEARRVVYGNHWIRVREDDVRLPDGRGAPYGVIEGGDAVGVLPFLDSDTVVLVRQYRYVAGRATWEMPTGAAAPGEPLEEAAQRELAEEAGYHAGRLTPLCWLNSNKSVVDEDLHLFVGEDLAPARAEPDDTEFFRVEALPFARVLEMVRESEITDSMTVVAVLHAALRRRG